MYIHKFNEYINHNIWYHGTPDARKVLDEGFIPRTETIQYVKDINEYGRYMKHMNDIRTKDEKEYFKMLDNVSSLMETKTIKSPIFFTDNIYVAKTYADDSRSFDYQNSEPKVFKVELSNSKVLNINALGDRFRFINVKYLINALVSDGIDKQTAEDIINKYNFYVMNKTNIKTDMISAIAQEFDYDAIDIKNVKDSYHGGYINSTVRMVFDPSDIKIIQ